MVRFKALETIVFINSVTNLCITKLDVLDGFEEIQVCIDYDQNQQPIYKTFCGWQQIHPMPGLLMIYLKLLRTIYYLLKRLWIVLLA
jgi:adenylosuccinate synthase